LTTWC